MMVRTGIGYDLHPLIPGRRLVLGGIDIPSDTGEAGHSDGDVLIHAVVDALLGAAALGDIGTYFPDTDPAFRNVPSHIFLERTLSMLTEKGYQIGNIDATIILEAPKLRPFISRICGQLATLMNTTGEAISVKATTHEKVGALGSGKAIACFAVATICLKDTDDPHA